jgi:hypothetical protein
MARKSKRAAGLIDCRIHWTVTERIPLKATGILDGFLCRQLGDA